MASATGSKEKFNARELMESDDAMRLQNLIYRDVADDNAYETAGRFGIPYSGLVRVPSLTGVAGSFTMALGAGRGWYYDPTFAGLSPDDSFNQVLRWPAQVLTFSNPDGSNPRIDLIVAAPAMVDADSFSRNILVDPVSRTITPQNVFKTSNPVSNISVVQGTPASVPIPPVLPAGSVALFEVYVPASVGDATAFLPAQRLWRKSYFPGASRSGVMQGCKLVWSGGTPPASVGATLILNGSPFNKIVIDGEVIEWRGCPAIVADTLANPFGSAAPATSSRPYYIYACGGRFLPQGMYSPLVTGFFAPVVLVESLTAPDIDGAQPAAPIQTPRGQTQNGAVLIGIGFTYRNTVLRQACVMTKDWVFGYDRLEHFAAATDPVTIASSPSNLGKNRMVRFFADGAATSGSGSAVSAQGGGLGDPLSAGNGFSTIEGNSTTSIATGGMMDIPLDATNLINFLAVNTAPNINVVGYEHLVPRI